MTRLHRLLSRRRRPYDWRTERECEWLWDELPPSHVKVIHDNRPTGHDMKEQ